MKPLKAASSNSDAMSNFQNPLSEGQQVVPLPGAEQTTSLLVVLIVKCGGSSVVSVRSLRDLGLLFERTFV